MRKEWIVYTVTGVVLLAVLFGFSIYSNTDTRTHGDLDDEAQTRAREYLDRIMAKCGWEYYSEAAWTELMEGKIFNQRALFQLKSPTPIVKNSPISKADELNGIQWHGSMVIIAVAHRRYDEYTRSWSAWQDGTPKHTTIMKELTIPSLFGIGDFRKQNGRWNSDEQGGRFSDRKPECSEIPPD